MPTHIFMTNNTAFNHILMTNIQASNHIYRMYEYHMPNPVESNWIWTRESATAAKAARLAVFCYLRKIIVPFWRYTYTLLPSVEYLTAQSAGKSDDTLSLPVIPLGASMIL